MARSQPITWRNVGINDGSSSASLGNAASNFGSAAIQGLDIFSGQMQDRVTREDALLTNEAIGSALNGGPQISNNRRVDATALQSAVEKNLQGVRLAQSHAEDLQTADLTQAGLGLQNEADAYKVSVQEQVHKAEMDAKAADIEYKQTQGEEAKLRMQETRRAYEDAVRAREADNALTDYYAVGQEEEFKKRFEEDKKIIDGWDNLTSDQQAALYRQRRDNVYSPEAESDPYRGVKVAKKLGYSAADYYGTTIGQEDIAAQRLVQEKEADRILLQEETAQAVIDSAITVVNNGNFKDVIPDSSVEGGFTFAKDATQVSAGSSESYARQLNMDLEKDQAAKDLVQTVRAAFPAEAAYRVMLKKSVDEDGNVIEGAEDRIFADQQRARLLAEAVVRKSTTAPTLGNASGDLQTAVNGMLGLTPKGEPLKEEIPAVPEKEQKVLDSLGLDQLEVHPDKDRQQIVDQVKVLADKLETKKRTGSKIPLSDQELERARQELVRTLEKAVQPPLDSIDSTRFGAQPVNIGIQPK